MNFDFINKTPGFNSAILCLNEKFRTALEGLDPKIKQSVQEIRVRVNRNLAIICPQGTYFLSHDGKISSKETLLYAIPSDISEIVKIICSYSIYSYQNQIKNGFITLRGGHRAGICGTAIVNDTQISNIRDISSINIRIAKEIKGCCEKILEKISFNPKGTLIAGPPSSGKTTILRDLARKLSLMKNNKIKKVAVVDERGEIGAVYQGIPQVDIGLCDVLNGYPKGVGIVQAVRLFSPDIIICDEIGLVSEIQAIEEGLNAGVEIIASVHLGNKTDIWKRKQVKSLIATGAFQNIVILNEQSKYTGEFEFLNVEELHADKGCRDFDSDCIRDAMRTYGGL